MHGPKCLVDGILTVFCSEGNECAVDLRHIAQLFSVPRRYGACDEPWNTQLWIQDEKRYEPHQLCRCVGTLSVQNRERVVHPLPKEVVGTRLVVTRFICFQDS